MPENKCVFTQENLKNYFEKFDNVLFKYKNLLGSRRAAAWLERYQKFQDYETAQQFAELTRVEYSDLQEALDMSYGNRKQSDLFLQIYDLVRDRIIRQYINIDGIERMFSEKYASFEWEMHLGIDYKKHSMNYYRDHFIHQIRDAYAMVTLLEKQQFYEKVKEILTDRGRSKISRYFCKMLMQEMYCPRKEIFADVDEDTLREHYIYNMIYMTAYMAALFHDIGYPVAHAMGKERSSVEYLIETRFFGNGGCDFQKIVSLLQNSLLFRVVPVAEIRSRIERKKADHGTMSALLFLLHFYESGAIARLEPYKVCAVEMAALAIYNHTNKYAYIDDDETAYERCVFSLNPISYLLRVCDDLQEWDRIYFELLKQSNLVICSQCHMPIVRNKVKIETSNGIKYETKYQCYCHHGQERLFESIFAYDQFPCRRLYNVTVCTELISETKDGRNFVFRLEYRLDRLLHIAYMNSKYAKYRSNELRALKKFFVCQDKIGMVFLDYFMTCNVVLIKSESVRRWIERERWFKGIVKQLISESKWGDIQSIEWEKIKESISRWIKGWEMLKNDDYAEYIEMAFRCYVLVAALMEYMRNCHIKNQFIDPRDVKDKITFLKIKILPCYFELTRDFFTDDGWILLEDCLNQIPGMYKNLDNYNFYPNCYMEAFSVNDQVMSANQRFVETTEYLKNMERKSVILGANRKKLDAYSDLYCIQQILSKLYENS